MKIVTQTISNSLQSSNLSTSYLIIFSTISQYFKIRQNHKRRKEITNKIEKENREYAIIVFTVLDTWFYLLFIFNCLTIYLFTATLSRQTKPLIFETVLTFFQEDNLPRKIFVTVALARRGISNPKNYEKIIKKICTYTNLYH